MTKKIEAASHVAMSIMHPMYPGAPRIVFAPETGGGSGGSDDNSGNDEAAKKAAADEAAAAEEEAKARKELEDAEAAAALAADSGKDAAALAAEKRDLLREVMDKKTKLKEAQAAAKAAADKLSEYDGIDVAKYRELVRKEAEAEAAAAEARGDFERVKLMMKEEHIKETKSLTERITALESELGQRDSAINALTVGNSFGNSLFIKESLTLTPAKARQLYGDHFEVQDGRTVAYDKPANKKDRTMLVDASGEPLPFDEAFKRIIDADPDKETLLRARINQGSGSNSNGQRVAEKKPSLGFGIDRIRASFEKK